MDHAKILQARKKQVKTASTTNNIMRMEFVYVRKSRPRLYLGIM